jgi:hypothetical protein
MPHIHILIVTHGGWIDFLMKQLIEDLNFEVAPSVIQHGFPKPGSMYQFKIYKLISKDKDDYDWKGRIELMNSTSHLANLKRMIEKKPLPAEPSSSSANLGLSGPLKPGHQSLSSPLPPTLYRSSSQASSLSGYESSLASSEHSSNASTPDSSPQSKRRSYLRLFGFSGPKNSSQSFSSNSNNNKSSSSPSATYFSLNRNSKVGSSPIVSSPLSSAQAKASPGKSSPLLKNLVPRFGGGNGSPKNSPMEGSPKVKPRKKTLGW